MGLHGKRIDYCCYN